MTQYVGTWSTPSPTPEPTTSETQEATNTPTPTETPIPDVDLVVYVVDEQGTVYGIRNSTGSLEGKIALNATGVRTSPLVNVQTLDFITDHPFVVFGADDGYVYIAALDGTTPCTNGVDNAWEGLEGGGARVSVGASVRSSPAVAADGTIYVTTADGLLHAIGPEEDAIDACETWTPTPTSTPTATETPT
jgi:outer membrane protein assembly factor BamB